MEFGSVPFWLGVSAALLVGFSKTGLPGASIPAVALMAEAFRDDTRLSVGALLPVLLLGDLFAISYYRRHAQWQRLIELFPYVVAGMIPGYLVLWLTPTDGLRVVLGVVVLALLALHVVHRVFKTEILLEAAWFNGLTGALAGFGTTVGNAAGPVMSIFLLTRRLDKNEFLGTSAWFFFLVNLSKIPFFTALGMINAATLRFDAMVAPVLIVGAVLGFAAVKWIPQAAFDALVLLLAGAAAFRMILQ
jgi:uncharacterized membrane protein YfcA